MSLELIFGKEIPGLDFIIHLSCKNFDEKSQKYCWSGTSTYGYEEADILAYTSKIGKKCKYPKIAYYEIFDGKTSEFWRIRQHKNRLEIIKNRKFLSELFFLKPDNIGEIIRDTDIDFNVSTENAKKVIRDLALITIAVRNADLTEYFKRKQSFVN